MKGVASTAVIAVLAVTAPAGAVEGADKPLDEAATRRIVREYGTCMVRHYHDRLKAFVLSTDSTVPPPKPIPECVGQDGLLRMPQPIYRIVFAEALLRRDYKTALPARLVAGGREEPGAPTGSMLVADAMELTVRLDLLGRCVAYRRPLSAQALIATFPNTPPEGVAMNALMPTLTACGVRGVLPQSINNVRGAIAVGLYRAAVAESG